MFAIGFIQFSNTLDYPYVWDDILVIERNPDVQAGIEGISEIFRKQNTDKLHDLVGYRPVALTTFALEQEFFGMDPSVGHFNNVLLFSLLCVVIYQLLVLLFFRERKWIALLIVILYAVHPLHTEVVANIKSRDELLQFLFGCISLMTYVLWFRKPKHLHWLLLSLLSFGLAFLSKENALAMLGVIGITILFFEKYSIAQKLTGLLPVAAAGISALLVMQFTLTTTEGAEETEGWGIFYEDQVLGNSFMELAETGEYISNGIALIPRYLYNFIYPMDLVYYSGYNQIQMIRGFSLYLLFSFAVLFGLLILALWTYKKKPEVAFGILLFLILLSPFLQIAVRMSDTMADRFMFGPSLGLCMATVLGLLALVNKMNRFPHHRKTLSILVLVLAIPYSARTFHRNLAWQDAFTLFSTDMPKLENCARAHKFMANEWYGKYQRTEKRIHLDKTIHHLERCIEISDKTYHAQLELGYNYGQWGNPGRGIEILEKAVKRFPESMDPHFYLGNLYMENGDFLLAKLRFKQCTRLTPRIVDPYFLLANCHLELAEYDTASSICIRALKNWPGDNRFRDIRANMFLRTNQPDSAINEVGQMLIVQPENPDLWKKLIGYYNVLGMEEEARITFEDAVNRGIISPTGQ